MTPTPPLRRILFVDDDPQLLSGLGKGLRKHRERWVMVFADSGEAALAEIRRGSFDVVVSDMRMPVMDGAALLASVRDHDPTTIRMILSGFSDRNAIVRALPVAHQFFNKPCDLGELSGAIDRACELRALFASDALRAVIGAIGALPPTPVVYYQLSAMLGRPDLTFESVAAVIEQDIALWARVLRAASSSCSGSEPPLTSISEAVSRLGVELVVALALGSQVLALAGDRRLPEFPVAELQHHALQVARAAREQVPSRDLAAAAFVAGLVHEVGKIVIAAVLPDAHQEIMARIAATGAPASDVERSVLGTSHAEIGAYLMGRWGLPLPIVHAIAHHNGSSAATTPLLTVLRAARAAHAAGHG